MFGKKILFVFLFSSLLISAQSKKKDAKKVNHYVITNTQAKSLGLPTIKSPAPIKNQGKSSQNKKSSSNRIGKASINSLNKAKNNSSKSNKSSGPQLNNSSLKLNNTGISKFLNSGSKSSSSIPQQRKNTYKHKSIKYSKHGTPVFIKSKFIGDHSSVAKKSEKERVSDYLEEVKDIIKIKSPKGEFKVLNKSKDQMGFTHIKYKQTYNDVLVYAKEIIVHLDKKGSVKSLSGSFIPTPEEVNTDPVLNAKKIIKKLPEIFEKNLKELKDHNDSIEPTLVIYQKDNQNFLAWHLTIFSSELDRWELFIDDTSGEILDNINSTCYALDHVKKNESPKRSDKIKSSKKESEEDFNAVVGTGSDLNGVERELNTTFESNYYYLYDTSKPSYNSSTGEGVLITYKSNYSEETSYIGSDSDNTWTDASLVSAHYNASESYDYFYETFSRNSIDGSGGTVRSFENVKNSDGTEMNNAYWNGKGIYYGNGEDMFTPLAGALDVAAHEWSHGVVEWTSGFVYQDESGALNESFADIFGVMVDRDDWAIGEDIVNSNYYPNGFLRSMKEPEKGDQPSHYDDAVFLGTNTDNGGVHYNSGIPNKAFYLIASDIGKEKAEQIYYRALTTYLTRSSGFIMLRIALEESAVDFHGGSSPELASVKQALDAVGIVYREVEEEDPIEIDGDDLILSYDTDSENPNTFYISDTEGEILVPISTTKTINKPSLSSDGYFLVFVNDQNHLVVIDQIDDTIYEYTISDNPIWNSVAISKDKSKIALTTELESDPYIYVYDLINNQWGSFKLYSPTTAEGVTSGEILYADALEWDNRSEIIIFDQLNKVSLGDSEDLYYWDIGLMDIWDSENNKFDDGNILKLYSQIPENVSIGYPSFAKTTNSVVTFDWIQEVDGEYETYVVLLDLETSDIGYFENNTWGVPNFATLDNQVIYNALDQDGIETIYSRGVEDFIFPSETSKELIWYGDWGTWFNQGLRDFDKDGVLDNDDACPNSPEGKEVDENGCSLSQKDTDQDGVNDEKDNCIETSNADQIDTDEDGKGNACDDDDDGDGVSDDRDSCQATPLDSIVDLNGCKVFSLPQKNYSLSVGEVSCVGENDGSIILTVDDKTYDYVVSISETTSVSLNSSNEHKTTIDDLEPGIYEICFSVNGEDGYNQCFEIKIIEPAPLASSSKVNKSNQSVEFNLSGSDRYTITHNGKVRIYKSNNPILSLHPGVNFIEISTDKYCQGTYTEEIFVSEKVQYYPNPTKDIVNFYIHGEDTKVNVVVVDVDGNLFTQGEEKITSSRKIQVDLSNLNKGVYIVRLNGETVNQSIKIIRK